MGETTDGDRAADPAGKTCGPPLPGSCCGSSVGAVRAAPPDPGVEDPLAWGDSVGDALGERTCVDPAVDAPPGSDAASVRSTPGALLSPRGGT